MLKAVFYARFHPERGPSIIHQYPKDSTGLLDSAPQSLFRWSDISSYTIPSYDLCNQSLAICTNEHRILGFPISIEDPKYERNRFTFNVCFVLAETEDPQPWTQVVRKTARFFTSLEEEDELLQSEELLPGLKWAGEAGYPTHKVGIVYDLLESIQTSLNTYGETCVRVSDVHVLNLRLLPSNPPPVKVCAWDVPLLIRSLPETSSWTWDIALQRIHAHIDGVKHVQRIAEVADVELRLVKRTVRDLIFHERAMLLDIFHFQATYACSPKLALFVREKEIQDECRRYVMTGQGANSALLGRDPASHESAAPIMATNTLVELYCALQPGLSLADFCVAYKDQLGNIDIRRFITFGVIKGFINRMHRFVLSIDPIQPPSSPIALKKGGTAHSKPKSNEDVLRDFDRAWKKAVLSSGWATPPSDPPRGYLSGSSNKSADEVRSEEDDKLKTYLDGKHCMDQICVEMHMSPESIMERLKAGRFGEIVYLNR